MYPGRVIVRCTAPTEDGSTVPAAVARYRMRLTKRLWLTSAAIVAAVGLSVPSASAAGTDVLLPSCGATSHPFKAWSDPAAYCAFSNLGFESGATGWT